MIHYEFYCACGEEWTGPVPRKYQNEQFWNPILAEWKKKHQGHLYRRLFGLID